MCGIIGYTGRENGVPKIVKGLSVLEYRGYDSAGIAAETESGIEIIKSRGRIGALCEKLAEAPISSHTAIGHTRWATHGAPSDVNAHPHRAGRVTLVHNGIIENCAELREELSGRGWRTVSETDTEIAAALIAEEYERTNSPLVSIKNACARMVGSYAFAIIFDDARGVIYAVRRGSPLLLGRSTDGSYLASDMTALLPFTRQYYPLEEGEIACLSADEVEVYNGASSHTPSWKVTEMTADLAQKGGYSHFMLKEIFEQPESLRKALSPRLHTPLPDFSSDSIEPDFWRKIGAFQIVACGSATHAGMVGAHFIERYARIPVTVHTASEYRYSPPLAAEGTAVLLISQSGETADTLAALRYAKSQGLPTLAIVNAVETSIAREADRRIYTYAGPEIAVATTKGYATQAAVLALIAIAAGLARGVISASEGEALSNSLLHSAPDAIADMLKKRAEIASFAQRLKTHEHVFFIGRGLDYSLALEAALKLKEISYIHAEAYAAGELKHGTISLVEQGTPVAAITTDPALSAKTESNIREVASRGADVIRISSDESENCICVAGGSEFASFFSAMTACQLLAFETALARGCDIDKPRNLAKSVTVE
jgi:glucosamine--fructose-6-phosphate aminotransferase (isomerizing)